MRHIASYRDGDIVKYALVDEETGELVQFAQLKVPDHFDFEASALLGTNLVEVLGLNGHKRPRAHVVVHDEPGALPPVEETTREKRARRAREAYARKKASQEAAPRKGVSTRDRADPANKVQYHISLEEVVAVINRLPDGSTARRIAQVFDNDNPEPARWIVRTVENRLATAQMNLRDKGTPLPFRIERVMEGAQERRVIYPLAGLAPTLPLT